MHADRSARARAGVSAPLWGWALAALAAIPLCYVAVARLDGPSQTLFMLATIAVFFVVNRFKTGWATVFLVALSATVSLRYLYWRMTETMAFETATEAFLGTGLFLAELYAFVVLILGYMQSVRPLRRTPTPLPDDVAQWPSIDVYIPTFNESLDVVANTVLGAMSMDYPAGRLRVYLLDDGARPEFAAFAAEAGCGYLARSDNRNAKAGNLNAALARTDGDLVAIFDSDHVPTRAFLQMTVGAFLKDARLALVQTPHHFYSPDPIERNVAGPGAPNEAQLFYGLLQEGNDFWGAAFFCGSCAVLRRRALDDIGGFATETVTEDAHTALKLHRLGWKSAYIRLPLAAGLATERLSLHVAQRMRWARGMTQIFRLDNPLLGLGLSLGQRLCYLNAMLHFFFALPRFVFLTAPLAYLLAEQNIITATWDDIFIYAFPHLAHSALTNSRLHGRHRYTFWGEIYESVLSFHMIKPTLMTLINPRRGAFNVTEKGGLLPQGFFDRPRVAPHIALAAALILALALGCLRLTVTEGDLPLLEDVDSGVVALNMFWAGFNLILVLAAIAVAQERRQVRNHVRVPVELPTRIAFGDGRTIEARSIDLSIGGGLFAAGEDAGAAIGAPVALEVSTGSDRLPVAGEIVGAAGGRLRIRFPDQSIAQRRILVRLIFGRADAWLHWDDRPPDSVPRAAGAVLRGVAGLLTRKTPRPARTGGAAATLLLGIAVGLFAAVGAPLAQTVSGPDAAPTLPSARSASAPGAMLPSDAPPPQPGPLTAQPGGAVRLAPLTALGMPEEIEMRSVKAVRYAPFTLRADRIVDAAVLDLMVSYSPALLERLSTLYVFLNGEPVGRMALAARHAGGVRLRLPIKPALLGRRNTFRFETDMHYREACEDPINDSLRLTLHTGASRLELAERPLPLADDLALLPRPFVDPDDMARQRLTFVLPSDPSNAVLAAAGVVASWFGGFVGRDRLDIHVSYGAWDDGSAVLFAAGDAAPRDVDIGLDRSRNLIAVTPRPDGRAGAKALILSGADEAGLLALARQLALLPNVDGLTGPSAEVTSGPELPERRPDDARRWLPLDRPVSLGALAGDALSLQAAGPSGFISAPFRMPPRRFPDEQGGPILNLEFDSLETPLFEAMDPARSRVDVSLNGAFQKTLPIRPRAGAAALGDALRGPVDEEGRAAIRIDPSVLSAPRSAVEFYYEMFPLKGDCVGSLPQNLRFRVQPSSTIDFSQTVARTVLPDLAGFVSLGYPFTRMADLSETVVVLSDATTPAEVAAYLNLMVLAGEATGEPAMRVAVARADDLAGQGDKDVLLVGAWPGASGLLRDWGDAGVFAFEADGVRVRPATAMDDVREVVFGDDHAGERAAASGALAGGFSGVASFERPDAAGRVVVLVAGGTPDETAALALELRDPTVAGDIRGDLVRMTPAGVASFRVNAPFTRTDAGRLNQLRWFLADRPFVLAAFLLVALGLMTAILHWLLRRVAAARVADAGRDQAAS